jgi:hypothetical protein
MCVRQVGFGMTITAMEVVASSICALFVCYAEVSQTATTLALLAGVDLTAFVSFCRTHKR